jgi:CheY-like chemotaxis protein
MTIPSPVTVLNVDDDPAGRYAITQVLLRESWQVREAATGRQALRRAAEQPDLILLDVRLPDLDGFEVCLRLRSDPATAAIPVLHLSAHFTEDADVARGLRHADGYLRKPLKPAELVAKVRELLAARQPRGATRPGGAGGQPGQRAALSAAARDRPLRVLVVDDVKDIADSQAMLLGLWGGFEVRVAYHGPAALEAARTWRPDVVLLDISMPGMSGYEVARRLRDEVGLAGARLVAITAYGDVQAPAGGTAFDHHLRKPADPEQVRRLLASCSPGGSA